MTKLKKKILIIEDTITYQQALKREFVQKGYEVRCASDGSEGLTILKQFHPNLIILDSIMPGMRGQDVCREIKMNFNYRHIPIMILTMERDQNAIAQTLEAGADSYVDKNESMESIARRVESLIQLNLTIEPFLKDEDDFSKEENLELRNKKLLLVDDDITYLQAAKRQLKESGFSVTTAMSGRECLESLMQGVPDLLLLDLRMPDAEGTEVCRQIRKIGKFQELPIVMLTASDAQNDILRSFESGVNDYVVKSCDFRIIKLRVYSILRRKHFESETRRIQMKLSNAETQALVAKAEKEIEAKYALDLAKKNEELDAFAYTLSHDLRAPLRSMVGFAILIKEDMREQMSENSKWQLDRVIKGGQKIEQMIKSILEYSRIGRMENHMEKVELKDLIIGVVEMLEADIREKKANIRIQGVFPVIECYKERVEQVFLNLISNSLKYARKGEVLEIVIGCQKKKGHTWIYVEDNGVGIKKKFFSKIFHLFARLHADEKDYEGTGIGLSTVQKIIDIHEGDIYLESKENQGTTFYFTFDRVHMDRKKIGEILIEDNAITQEQLQDALLKQGSRLLNRTLTNHLLIVDDDRDFLKLCECNIKRFKLDTTISYVSSGQEALDYVYQKNKYAQKEGYKPCDMLLLDINMPGLDGFDVLRDIKSNKCFKELPIISIYTSSDSSAEKKKARDFGAYHYITKSDDFGALVKEINKMKTYAKTVLYGRGRDE